MDKLKEIPLKLRQRLFVRIFDLAEYRALNKEEQKAYMESLKKYNDWQNVLDYAHKKGYKQASLEYERLLSDIEAILKQEKQRAEEEKKRAEEEKKRAEEEKKRAEEEKIKIIKELLSMGLSLENIMKATNTDEKFLKKHNLIS